MCVSVLLIDAWWTEAGCGLHERVMLSLIRQLWRARSFIVGSVRRDFQAKYQKSLLGAGWAVLNPLAMILIYTLVFSQIMQARLAGVQGPFAYGIFLCAGLLTWGYFVDITVRFQNVFVANANLIKKINFPQTCLPIIALLGASIDFLIVFGLFALFLLLSGSFPGWVFVSLLPLLALLVAFATSLGLLLGSMNVFVRDIGQLFGLCLTFWFWLTPIVYPVNILPAWVHPWLLLNPLAPLMAAFQSVIAYGAWPSWIELVPLCLLTMVLAVMARRVYLRLAPQMADEL